MCCSKNIERLLLSEVGRNRPVALVVARQTVDTAFYKDESELGVLVRSVSVQVLAHGHSLLDKIIQILGDLW